MNVSIKPEYAGKSHVVTFTGSGKVVKQEKITIPLDPNEKQIKDLVRQGVPVSFFRSENENDIKKLNAIAGSSVKKRAVKTRKKLTKANLVVTKKGRSSSNDLVDKNKSLEAKIKELEAQLESKIPEKVTPEKTPTRRNTAAKKT